MSLTGEFTKGIWKENPIFRIMLGFCPTLALSTKAINGIGMGISVIFVLVFSNLFIAALRNVIPSRVRIPCFIIIIATFVTMVDLVLAAYTPGIYKALGIFIPLIVVNCIILGRAEAFASKRPVWDSIVDGLGMGLGFTLALVVIGIIRELLGNGTIFDINIFGAGFKPALVIIMPPGGFIVLGFMLAGMNKLDLLRKKKKSA